MDHLRSKLIQKTAINWIPVHYVIPGNKKTGRTEKTIISLDIIFIYLFILLQNHTHIRNMVYNIDIQ